MVAIIAILSMGVGLSAGGLFAPRGGASAAERLAGGITRARDAALLGRGVTGIYPREDGWFAARRVGETWQREGVPLRLRGARLAWQVDGVPHLPGILEPGPDAAPPIQFAPDGTSTPFVLTLLSGSSRRDCRAPAGEALTCE